MGKLLRLETFEAPSPDAMPPAVTRDELEEERLAAFEKGYAAGWDDAVAAQEAEAAQVRLGLTQCLGDMGFTYREAHLHVLSAVEPLLHDVVAKVLPSIARETLGHVVSEQILPLARAAAGLPVVVAMNAATRRFVEPVLSKESALPIRLVEEPALSDGQVDLRFGEGERRVDLDGVIRAIGAAISDFFGADLKAEATHG
jgi:flagellar assembly protein FliH